MSDFIILYFFFFTNVQAFHYVSWTSSQHFFHCLADKQTNKLGEMMKISTYISKPNEVEIYYRAVECITFSWVYINNIFYFWFVTIISLGVFICLTESLLNHRAHVITQSFNMAGDSDCAHRLSETQFPLTKEEFINRYWPHAGVNVLRIMRAGIHEGSLCFCCLNGSF